MTIISFYPDLFSSLKFFKIFFSLCSSLFLGVTTIIGKLESGTIRKGDTLIIMPTEKKTEVTYLKMWEQDTNKASAGENCSLGLKGVSLEDLVPGYVLCSPESLCKAVRVVDAQLVMMNLKSVFTTGYQCVMHLHTAVEETSVRRLLTQMDKKTKQEVRNPRFLQNGSVATVRLQFTRNVCVELFEDYQQLGRFTLRDEGKTIAIGKVIDLPTLKKKEEK
jgi:peptide chain release factor subunit 3